MCEQDATKRAKKRVNLHLKMKTTGNTVAQTLAMLLATHGVKRVVVSPGSRNAPMLVAVDATEDLSIDCVVDERQAAFLALGIAQTLCEPVALICTSGSAPLNYMPAVSEAYYGRIPLIVITADRPPQWIGQDDSQTIRQSGVMRGIVKKDYHIPPSHTDEELWYAARQINDALITAVNGAPGPVHINVSIDEPIDTLVDVSTVRPAFIRMISPECWLSAHDIKVLAAKVMAAERVMVVCGFMAPDRKLNSSLAAMGRLGNVAIFTETLANLHSPEFVPNIDAALASVPMDDEAMRPQLVITIGGALVSRHLKEFLRQVDGLEHWHVSLVDDTVDCFKHLALRIATAPVAFFSQLVASIKKQNLATQSSYRHRWQVIRDRAISLTQSYAARSPWSDFSAMAAIHSLVPARWNVQYSNGTPVRYSQIFGFRKLHRASCNRGVSGIDGCTATAVGASAAYLHHPTLLITGDTSALYDIGALTLDQITPRFKVIVVDNGGGGIFRFIKATSQLPVLESILSHPLPVESIEHLASSRGFAVYHADSDSSLRDSFGAMAADTGRPGMLVVHTSAEISAKVLKEFFEYCKTH